LILPFNNIEKFEQTIKHERGKIAAVIMEPVIGNAGVILPEDGYLKRVRELTEENEIVLIFDEVITGFRMAFGGAQEYYGVTPDMVTLGKIMGGGFPLAAFGGKKEIMQMVAPSGKVYQAGTFCGNPISVAAGLAALKTIRMGGDSFYEELESKRRMICDAVQDLAEDANYPVKVNGIASMFQIFFTPSEVYDYESAKKADKTKFMNYHRKLLEKGIFIPPSQFETCFISTAHSKEDIEKTVEAIKESLKYAMK
jgi:glutamate-1-semialdehyde 2,1-aminomutase